MAAAISVAGRAPAGPAGDPLGPPLGCPHAPSLWPVGFSSSQVSGEPGCEEETPWKHGKSLKRPSTWRLGTPVRVTRALGRVTLTREMESETHAPRPERGRAPRKCARSLSSSPAVPCRGKGVPFTEKAPRFREHVRGGKGPVGSRAAAGLWAGLEDHREGLSFIRKNKKRLAASRSPVRPRVRLSVCSRGRVLGSERRQQWTLLLR